MPAIDTAHDLAAALNAYTGDNAYLDLKLYYNADRVSEDDTTVVIDGDVVVWDAPAKVWRVDNRPEPVVAGVRETDTEIEGGLDAEITIAGGLTVTVTVEPDTINGGYRPTGDSADCWIENFYDLDLSDEDVEDLSRAATGIIKPVRR